MSQVQDKQGTLLDEATFQKTLETFHCDGVAIVRSVLTAEECEMLCRKADAIVANREMKAASRHAVDFVISNPLLHDRMFADIFVREPILSLVEAILGPEARFCGESVVRNEPGNAITQWHVDDANIVDFPLPDDIPRHDARIRMPVFWMGAQIFLTGVESIEYGPTEYVRGSHYSGRVPNLQENPVFEGRGPEPILCKAGDMYLFNPQVWHRGSPNLSERTRYLLALQYARGGTRAWRFQGLPSSPQLDPILQGADERMLRVLGRTAPTYGL